MLFVTYEIGTLLERSKFIYRNNMDEVPINLFAHKESFDSTPHTCNF